MRIVHIKGQNEVKKPKLSRREKIEAFKLEFIRKHNEKFKMKQQSRDL